MPKKKSSLISEPFVCRCFMLIYFSKCRSWIQHSYCRGSIKQLKRECRWPQQYNYIARQDQRKCIWYCSINSAMTPEIQFPARNVGSFKYRRSQNSLPFIFLFLDLFSSTLKEGVWRCYTSFKASLIFTSLFALFVLKAVLVSQGCHNTWEKTAKGRERTKGFTLISRVGSPLLTMSCSYNIQSSLFSGGVTQTSAIKPEIGLDSCKLTA